jgi:hypothetical protein
MGLGNLFFWGGSSGDQARPKKLCPMEHGIHSTNSSVYQILRAMFFQNFQGRSAECQHRSRIRLCGPNKHCEKPWSSTCYFRSLLSFVVLCMCACVRMCASIYLSIHLSIYLSIYHLPAFCPTCWIMALPFEQNLRWGSLDAWVLMVRNYWPSREKQWHKHGGNLFACVGSMMGTVCWAYWSDCWWSSEVWGLWPCPTPTTVSVDTRLTLFFCFFHSLSSPLDQACDTLGWIQILLPDDSWTKRIPWINP